MSGARGLVAGTMALTLMQVIVSNADATKNVNGIVTFISKGMVRWLNPYMALIPDLRPVDKRGTTISLFPLGGSIFVPDPSAVAPQPAPTAPAAPASPTPHK